MNPILESILACPNLPSLPAVALRVIDLTADVNVSLKDLSQTIQNDQGLAAKILKTVNSSFYGLRQGCSTIDKALVMLGLSPVKSLALGFSLVASIDDPSDKGAFDYVGYWRRGLYTAVAARLIANRAGVDIGDEVFLGGLLQDVGMVAMHRALGERYSAVLEATRGNHRELVRQELQQLDLQHPDVGAMLVQRWKLPAELVMPVKYHERPSASPGSCADHVRCVGLGNLVHDVLTVRDAGPALRSLYERGKGWYRLESDVVEEIVSASAEASREMAGLFRLDVGPYTDASSVLTAASNRVVALAREAPGESSVSSHAPEGSVFAATDFDPLTGVMGPRGFESAIREGFRFALESNEPVAGGRGYRRSRGDDREPRRRGRSRGGDGRDRAAQAHVRGARGGGLPGGRDDVRGGAAEHGPPHRDRARRRLPG
ncbi:MAG: HDOD domain-containing protein [Phycisphaerales bacterium]|nr:HDOD domain-containing protein [Phycisphaerales bacterium]